MKHNNKKQAGCLSARIAALMATFCLCSSAWAENKVVIDNINILPGGEAVVNVDLQNEDNQMSSIQMDVVIPEGVDVKEGSIKFVGNRVDEEDFFLYMQKQQEGKTYRIVVLPQDLNSSFAGNQGNLLQFTVTANDKLKPKQQIEVKSIVGSDANAAKHPMSDFTVDVQQMVGSFSISAATEGDILLKPAVEGNSKRISFSLSNTISVRALEAVITLPEGAQVVQNEKGSVKIDRGSRVPTNLKFSSSVKDDKVKVVLSGLTADVLQGTEGEVFAFYVSGTEALPENSVVTVSDVILSDNAASSFDVYETHSLNLINMDKVYLTPAQEILDSLSVAYDEAMTTISEECADVKDSVSVQAAATAVKGQIDSLSAAIQTAYDDETLASDYDNIVAPQEEITAAIAALVETARKAQADFETAKALDAAYAEATHMVDSLTQMLADSMAVIVETCPNVKESAVVTEGKTAIEGRIATLSEAIEAAKADGTLTAELENVLAPKDEITAAIAALVETAKKAQADYETEQALNAAYAEATQMVDSLTQMLADSMAVIVETCPNVKESAVVTEGKTAIEGRIAALSETIEAAKADGTLTAELENILAPKDEIAAAITALVEAATQAQADFETAKALDAAYAEATQMVDSLTQMLADSMAVIEENCPDVKESEAVLAAKTTIEDQIAGLRKAVEAGKADGTLTAELENILAPKDEIAAAITALVEAATQAQADFEAAKALDEAYAYAQTELEKLDSAYNEAVETINNECADVKESETVLNAEASAKALIDALKEAVEAGKADGTLIEKQEELLTKKAEAEAAITAMVETAKKAQADYETEQALNAAYAYAQAELEKLDSVFAEAVETINNDCPDVKDSEAVQTAKTTIEGQVAALREAVEAGKADGTLIEKQEELMTKKAEVETAIASMVETAQKAQADYETEQALNAAYAYAQAELEKLDSVFAEAVETINNECPDVKDSEAVQTAKTTIEGQIAALREVVEAGKADGTLIEKQEELLTKKAEAEAAITAMVETAKKAQADYETEQALNAAYAYAQAELEKLDSTYNEAVETINNECADVKESETVLNAEASAKALIDALKEAVEAGKADGTLIEKQEELMTKKAEAEAAITAMVETAKKAQADYETEQALNAAYAQAIEVVNGLNQQLASAVTAIETFCPDAKDADVVTEAKAAIEAQIATLKEAIETAKADGSLTANIETVLAPKSDIEAAITALMEIAKKAQADYEAEQALNAAYAQAIEVVNELSQKLSTAMEAIETFCPDVKDSTLVTDAKAAIEEQISALSEAVEAGKADGSLTDSLATILAPKTTIEAAISKLLEDARQAQKDIDTGIEEIAAQQGASKIYTLSGKQVSRMEKGGIYLIKYANGTTKKIMVK